MIALDTNVLIYACDKADLKRQQVALELVASAGDGVLLWQVACEFVAASRKLRSQGFTTADAWDRLADYLGRDDRGRLPGMRRYPPLLGGRARPRCPRPA
jgi:predicted nucleic acid-binding protein